jgi:acetyl/propionyl-CoA carboxylase alpha subunit/acetyl-CoA carboxylase carboxyltransferase component
MPFKRMLIANRGEIAIRIAQAAADLGIESVAVHPADDASSLHVRRADFAKMLPGGGAAAYLGADALIALASETGCDAVHPGYGFLAESAAFARACAKAGLTFIGPSAVTLDLFGDKAAARRLAKQADVPVARGTLQTTSLEDMRAFLHAQGPGGAVMIKALAGGGGRGMRIATSNDALAEAYARASSEARAAFGSDALYVEELIAPARHIEIQVLGDAEGNIVHLYERECSLQRRHQKLVEIAPFPMLAAGLREAIIEAALKLADAGKVQTLATFEFLLDERPEHKGRFVFMEANPRLQVEHTVTEEVTGVDLVRAQIETAAGRSLAALHLNQAEIAPPRGVAIELRINLEKILPDGAAVPTQGVIKNFTLPHGRGIRIETAAFAGYATSPLYDPLLAKLIVTSPDDADFGKACARARRALDEFRIEGVETNRGFLKALLADEAVRAGAFNTGFITRETARLVQAADHRFPPELAASSAAQPQSIDTPAGTIPVLSPITGRLVAYEVAAGEIVRADTIVAIIEAMKMEHTITAGMSGIVAATTSRRDDIVQEGMALVYVEERDIAHDAAATAHAVDPDSVRPDLAAVRALHDALMDEARPQAVAARRKTGQRTARENIEDLCDPGSFIEYGALALAAQRRRRSLEELHAISPADGLIAGLGTINAVQFGEEAARAMVLAYDYTVLAGTQGFMNHKKMDRMLRLACESRMPLVLFAEGGGGRPGDTDHIGVAGLDLQTFTMAARFSGRAPSIAIVSGRCFAGNAALAACCDLLIATRNVSIGMGGPAMIEGGGLGRFHPDEVGPAQVQAPNGVIDILVADEAEAVAVAKHYLGFFQGTVGNWQASDQRLLRSAIPENRLRAYDVRKVVDLLVDRGSALEMQPTYGIGMLTFFARIEGRTIGLIANNPLHLGGAIDGEGAEKASRFIDLCETYELPVVSLCDTPGFMVGPEVEKTGLVRKVGRLFLSGANASVPMFAVVLRKGYGLGAMSMAAGSMGLPGCVVAWPTGEFGGMGLEGAVTLGYRAELAAIEDPVQRKARYDALVGELYDRGKATNMAAFLEIDAVIDPAETRHWLLRAMRSFPVTSRTSDKRRPYVPPR